MWAEPLAPRPTVEAAPGPGPGRPSLLGGCLQPFCSYTHHASKANVNRTELTFSIIMPPPMYPQGSLSLTLDPGSNDCSTLMCGSQPDVRPLISKGGAAHPQSLGLHFEERLQLSRGQGPGHRLRQVFVVSRHPEDHSNGQMDPGRTGPNAQVSKMKKAASLFSKL